MIQRLELNRPRCRPAGARPLRVLFLLTSMPVGGAETLLVNLIRTLDRERICPLVACLKERDVLGERLSEEIPVFDQLIGGKYDARVLPRLRKLMKREQIDAVVTVGAGDKMFWGRLAARAAGVPVILSALHSTGWPDGVGRLNRWLTPITDGFIAVAESHAEFQVDVERFPREKVYLVPNGIDTQRFQYSGGARQRWRKRLGIDSKAPVVGIVAALRPEKNHQLFLQTAAQIAIQLPQTRFVIAGDGPLRSLLQQQADSMGIGLQTSFLGSVDDVPGGALDDGSVLSNVGQRGESRFDSGGTLLSTRGRGTGGRFNRRVGDRWRHRLPVPAGRPTGVVRAVVGAIDRSSKAV